MSNVSSRHINTKHLLEYNTQKWPSKQSAFGSVCYWVVTLDNVEFHDHWSMHTSLVCMFLFSVRIITKQVGRMPFSPT